MRKLIIILSFLLLIQCAQTNAQEYDCSLDTTKIINVGCELDFPPFEYIDSNAVKTGFSLELLDSIMTRLHLRYNIVRLNSELSISQLKNGVVDMSIDMIFPDSTNHFYHTIPISMVNLCIICKEGKKYNCIDSLFGKKVMVKYLSFTHIYLKNNGLNNKIILMPVNSIMQGVKRFIQKDKFFSDAIIAAEPAAMFCIKSLDLDNVECNAFSSSIFPYCFSVAEDNFALYHNINRELIRMNHDGSYIKLYHKWFGEFPHQIAPPTNSLLLALVVLASVVIGIMTFVIVKLQTKNKNQQNYLHRMVSLYNTVNEAITICDLEGKVLFTANNAAKKIFNFSPDKTPNEIFAKFDTYLDSKLIDQHTILNTVINKNGFEVDYEINKKTEKNEIWFAAKSKIIRWKNNKYFLTVLTDISKLKQTYRTYQSSLSQIKIAINEGNLSIWSSSKPFTQIKPLTEDLFWKEEISTEQFFAMIYGHQKQLIIDKFKQLTEGKIEKTREIVIFKRPTDNFSGHYEILMKATKNEINEVFEIVGTLKDVSGDQSLYKRMYDFNEKMNLIFKRIEIVFYDFDVKTQTLLSSKEAEYSKNIIHKWSDFYNHVAKDDLPKINKFFNLMAKGVNKSFIFEARFLNDSRSEYIWNEVNTTPFKIEGNKVSRYVGFRRDNSRWKKINEELVEMRDKAEEANQTKSSFLANMSHEIRTPLNAIIGFSELLVDLSPEDFVKKKQYYKQIIVHNNQLLLNLINDVLDLSKMDAGNNNVNLVYTQVDINTVFEEIKRAMVLKIQDKEIVLDYVALTENNVVETDKNRLMQIMLNFVSNAIKFTQKGKIIYGAHSTTKNTTIYYCTDTGCGIPENKCKSIFDRFVKLDSFTQGSGLGLAICKTLAEKMGGSVWVNSIVDVGSSFYLELPNNKKNAIPL